MTYTGRALGDGRGIVLAPDGLTWEGSPLPSVAAAEAYAAALNDWVAARPLPDPLAALGGTVIEIALDSSPAELEAALLGILGRLAGPYDVRLPDRRPEPVRASTNGVFDGETRV